MRGVALLTAVGLVLRLVAGARFVVIERDAAVYLDAARALLAGDWLAGVRGHFPPGFPALVAAAGWLAGGVTERVGATCSALAGAAAIPALARVARRAWGPRAGLWAALLAATSPLAVELGGTILADGLYCSLIAWGLVFAQRAWTEPRAALGVSVCCGAAYLTRPEGVVVGVALGAVLVAAPRGVSAAGRLRTAAWLVAPGLLLAVPFVLAIRDTPVLEGGGVGELKLTRKRDLALYLGAATPWSLATNGLELLRFTAKALLPGLPLAAGLALGRPAAAARSARAGEARRLAALALPPALGLLVAMAIVRADRRYGAQLALFALPFVAAGAGRLGDRLRARRLRLAVAGLAVAVGIVALPWTLRGSGAKKATYRQAGALLRHGGVRTVLARDSRAGYYAGAETLPMVRFFPAARRPPSLADLQRVVAAERPDAVVLVVDDAAGQELSRAFARATGLEPARLRPERAVALDVFLLSPR